MSVVTTVRGDIDADQLGYTTVHEHLNADASLMKKLVEKYGGPEVPSDLLELRPDNLAFLRDGGYAVSDDCVTLGDVEYTATELGHFRRIGGNAVCDASPIGLRGDVRDLKAASERADVHVVFATGLYTAMFCPAEFQDLTEDELTAFFLKEVLDGVEDTGIRPGLLKGALSVDRPDDELRDIEVRNLRALGRVSAQTGLSLQIHTASPMSPKQVLAGVDVALSTGMAPDRLVMIHMDSFLRPWDALESYIADMTYALNVSTDLQRAVLDRGVNIGFDSWSSTVDILPGDYDRVKGLVDLLRAGYGSQIVLGHDNSTKPHGKSYGYYGLTRFGQFVPPILQRLGFEDDAFRRLVVDNPARILGR